MPFARKTALAIVAAALIAGAPPIMAKDASPQASTAAQQAAKADPARLAEARKLMELTASDKIVDQIMGLAFGQVAQLMVRMKPEKQKEIMAIIKKLAAEMSTGARKQELRNTIAEIYARELSLEDLKKLNAFYQTDTGRRFIEKMPTIMAQSQRAGMAWGRKLAEDMMKRTREEAKKQGIDL